MLQQLCASHPDLAATDPELLRLIDDAYGHGVFRNDAEPCSRPPATSTTTDRSPARYAEDIIYDAPASPSPLIPAGGRR